MARLLRHFPAYSATAALGLILLVFIALPVGMVLSESVRLAGPIPLHDLARITEDALERLDPADRARQTERWVGSLRPEERTATVAGALALVGMNVPWDRRAPFDEQAAAAEAAVRGLTAAQRQKFDAVYPLAAITLHKRIALAFRLRDKLTPAEFDQLREGTRQGYGLDHYMAVFNSPRLQTAFRNSLSLSAVVSVVATATGFVIAYGINRGAILGSRLVRYLTLIPLVSPPVVIATASILMFGRNGAVTKGLLQDTFGLIDADQTNLYGWGGVILAQTLAHVPHAFIILDNVLSKHDGRIEEAAASQGASAWQVFARVTLPMTQPGIARSLVLVFMLIMTDFGNPLIIGRDIPVLAGILYDEMTGFQNTRLAAAVAVWMILPALLIYVLIERIGRRKRYASAVGAPPELPVPAQARFALNAVAWGVIGLTLVLYGAIVLASFVKIWRVDHTPTLAWYITGGVAGFVSEQHGVTAVWESVKVAGLAAPVGGMLAVALAYLVERARVPGGNALGFIALLPAILPGVILGVGYVVAFNLPLGIKSLALTGTMVILVLNILFANMFIGYLAGRAVLQRYDAVVEEAAESLGASLWQRFAWVTLPVMRHALVLGTLYVFVHGLTTLSAVIFLVSPAHKLASVEIFDAAERGHYGVASALSVTILLIVFAVMGLIHWMERRGPVWAKVGALAADRA
ncbi:MAG: iron ABC transporter permease [Alphaproteobacteria bacterium]|nr:iron ABC transporter permease [Alphaproteobacteria bacterium]